MGSKWALRWPQACQLKYFCKSPTENKDPTYFYLSPLPFDKQWTRISQEEAYMLNTMLTLWVAPAFGAACVARGRHAKGRKASSFSPLAHSRDQNKPAPAIQASICYRAQRSSNLSIVEWITRISDILPMNSYSGTSMQGTPSWPRPVFLEWRCPLDGGWAGGCF